MNEILQNADPRTGPSFSLRNRMARGLWGCVFCLFFRLSPRPFHFWRRFLLKAFGAKVGRNVHVYPNVEIWAPWNLILHDKACIGDGARLYSMATIAIGAGAVVSQGSHLCAGTHDYESANFQLLARPIEIGARAWICADVFVGPGIAIEEGAVIGARSVVTKSMPAWMVCAGNPCRPLKARKVRADGA